MYMSTQKKKNVKGKNAPQKKVIIILIIIIIIINNNYVYTRVDIT